MTSMSQALRHQKTQTLRLIDPIHQCDGMMNTYQIFHIKGQKDARKIMEMLDGGLKTMLIGTKCRHWKDLGALNLMLVKEYYLEEEKK